uniref:Interferon-related developmental regulator N-terminal domain-containing protein n=1 Tax=Anopheles stephensi TaxID=30069 RepID=A0A182Y1Z1_ANOST
MALQEDEFEEKLFQAIDDTADKRQQTRIEAYDLIREILMHNYIPEALTNRKMALLAALERSLRKGNEKERIVAAKLIPLLVIQCEAVEGVQEIEKLLKPVLITTMKDAENVACSVTVHCSNALGMLCLAGEKDPDEILAVMRIVQEILQEDLPYSVTNKLYAGVLNSWSLLLTLLAPKTIVEQINGGILLSSKDLVAMLEETHLAVRTSSSKTLALMHELGHQYDPSFLHDELPDFMDILQKLSTTSNKYQAKKNRKQQRHAFREVLHYFREGVTPEIGIKFEDETLHLDRWAIRHQYSCLKTVLTSGMNVHLKENLLVRDILQLGPKVSKLEKRSVKMLKLEQRLSNGAASKKRSITRGKERDIQSCLWE